MNKWKIIMPTIAFGAVAPIAATTISCGCHDGNIKMDFEESIEEYPNTPGFIKRNFDIKGGQEYAFDVDMNNASDEAITKWGGNGVEFEAVDFTQSQATRLKINPEKVTVIFNGKELPHPKPEKQEDPEVRYDILYENTVIKILWTGGDRKWKKSDNFTIKLAWQNDLANATILCGSFK